jgi:hypothetical protein
LPASCPCAVYLVVPNNAIAVVTAATPIHLRVHF